MFYEVLFYSIALGYLLYEVYRQIVDSKAKEVKLQARVKQIGEKLANVRERSEKLGAALEESQWVSRHFAFETCSNYLLFLLNPNNE